MQRETYFNKTASDVNVIWSKHCDTGVGPSKNLNKLVADIMMMIMTILNNHKQRSGPGFFKKPRPLLFFVTCSIFFSENGEEELRILVVG